MKWKEKKKIRNTSKPPPKTQKSPVTWQKLKHLRIIRPKTEGERDIVAPKRSTAGAYSQWERCLIRMSELLLPLYWPSLGRPQVYVLRHCVQTKHLLLGMVRLGSMGWSEPAASYLLRIGFFEVWCDGVLHDKSYFLQKFNVYHRKTVSMEGKNGFISKANPVYNTLKLCSFFPLTLNKPLPPLKTTYINDFRSCFQEFWSSCARKVFAELWQRCMESLRVKIYVGWTYFLACGSQREKQNNWNVLQICIETESFKNNNIMHMMLFLKKNNIVTWCKFWYTYFLALLSESYRNRHEAEITLRGSALYV